MKIIVCFLSFSLLFCFDAVTQEAVLTSGGNASGSGGSASYSVGQLVSSFYTCEGGSVLHGVQQPYEISIVSTSSDKIDIKLSPVVYPVPAIDHVRLELPGNTLKKMKYQLLDLNGKVLTKKNITETITKIPLAGIPKGIYFLRVSGNGKNQQTFKIIKN